MTHLSAYIVNNKLQTIKKDISEEEITMSKKDGYSSTGLFGNINHYDSKGRKIGESRPGIFGGINHYDDRGHKTGHSNHGIFGGWDHYDD